MVRERVDIIAVLHDRVSQPAKKVERAIDDIGDSADDASKRIDHLEGKIKKLKAANKDLNNTVKDMTEKFDALDAVTGRVSRSGTRMSRTLNRISNGWQRGKGMIEGYFTSLSMLKMLFTDMAAMLPIVAQGLKSLGAAGVALTGQIASLTRGVGFAIPALSSFVQYFTVGALAISAFSKNSKLLNRNARELNNTFKSIKRTYSDLGAIGANGIADYVIGTGKSRTNLSRELDKLSKKYKDTIKEITYETGKGIGAIGVHFSRVFRRDDVFKAVKVLGKEGVAIGESFGKAFTNIAGGFAKIGAAAAPTLTKFAKYFEKATGKWMQNLSVEEMEKKFEKTGEKLKGFWQGIKALSTGLSGLFRASGDLGNWLTGGLKDKLIKWSEDVNSAQGQARLKKFFDDQKEPLAAIGRLFSSAWTTFKDIDSKNFVAFLDKTTEGMPQLKNLFEGIDENVLPPLIGIMDKLNQVDLSGGMKAVGLFVDTIDKLLGLVVSVTDALPEGVGDALTTAVVGGMALNTLTGGLLTSILGSVLGAGGSLIFGGRGKGGKGGKDKSSKTSGTPKSKGDSKSKNSKTTGKGTPKTTGKKNIWERIFGGKDKATGKGGSKLSFKGGAKSLFGGLLGGFALSSITDTFMGGGDAVSTTADASSVAITAGTVYVNGSVSNGTGIALGGSGGDASGLAGLAAAAGLGFLFRGNKNKGVGGAGTSGNSKATGIKKWGSKIPKGGLLGTLATWLGASALMNWGDGVATSSRDGSWGGAAKATGGSMLSSATNGALWGSSFGPWGALALGGAGLATGLGSSIKNNVNDLNPTAEGRKSAWQRVIGSFSLGGASIFDPKTWVGGVVSSGTASLIPSWGRNNSSGARRGGGGSFGYATPQYNVTANAKPAATRPFQAGYQSPVKAVAPVAKTQAAPLPDMSGAAAQAATLGGSITGLSSNIDGAISKVGELTAAVNGVPKDIPISVTVDTAAAQAKINGFISGNSGRTITVAVNSSGSGVLAPFSAARATGGEVSSGMSVLVGERGAEGFLSKSGKFSMIGEHGPEIRNFSQDGFVIPNHMLKDKSYMDAMTNVAPNVSPSTAASMMNGSDGEYVQIGNIEVNINGNVDKEVDIERAIRRAMAKQERARKERH